MFGSFIAFLYHLEDTKMKDQSNPYFLVIALRVCPVLAKTAWGFSDKLELVRASCRSMRRALDLVEERWKLKIILDGCPPSYRNMISSEFSDSSGVIQFIDTMSIGNQATYSMQIDILLKEYEAEIVYFAEDDYIYAPEAFVAMLDWMRHKEVDFVTPLDHPDAYVVKAQGLASSIRISRFHHWREVDSTCLTFMTKAETLRRFERTFRYFARYGEEGSQWLSFTQRAPYSIRIIARAVWLFLSRTNCHFGEIAPLCTWRRHLWALLFRRRCSLWCPIPSLAVHCSKDSIPPFTTKIIPSYVV